MEIKLIYVSPFISAGEAINYLAILSDNVENPESREKLKAKKILEKLYKVSDKLPDLANIENDEIYKFVEQHNTPQVDSFSNL
jgi:hypothetical protein